MVYLLISIVIILQVYFFIKSKSNSEIDNSKEFNSLKQQIKEIQFSILKGEGNDNLTKQINSLLNNLGQNQQNLNENLQNQFQRLQELLLSQLNHSQQNNLQTTENLRNTLNERLQKIQTENAQKLEEMRKTVDEKLQTTLENRLSESFKLVSERLEQVHKGLGEMQNLAGNVGDLKRIMSNVKTRGTWGELQLGNILDNILTSEQFVANFQLGSGTVEFAIRLPGKSQDEEVFLPIDSKFPIESYQRLEEATDKSEIETAKKELEQIIKSEAKKISEKYIFPPKTTNFAIMYLPTESLFAEVVRIPGLIGFLQNKFRVDIAGPTTFSSLVNSLQLGFKTLAIEKRSAEVWEVLESVKTEFGKFNEVVDEVQKSIENAAKKFDKIGTRTRALNRSLSKVEENKTEKLDNQDLLKIEIEENK